MCFESNIFVFVMFACLDSSDVSVIYFFFLCLLATVCLLLV